MMGQEKREVYERGRTRFKDAAREAEKGLAYKVEDVIDA
jgi:hypothetical protein